MKWSESCSIVSNSLRPHEPNSPWNSPGQKTGVGTRSLLQGIFPTQGLNPGLLHCTWILYQLSHKKSPRILEWIADPFSRRHSWPRNQTVVSSTAGRFFTNWAIREALSKCSRTLNIKNWHQKKTWMNASTTWVQKKFFMTQMQKKSNKADYMEIKVNLHVKKYH